MFGMGWAELVILALVGLFVLGPERLPDAIRWVARAVEQVKGYAATAKQQLDSEELAELRRPIDELRQPLADLRAADPRRAIRDVLRSEERR
jgi:sec-independent protein translocase protein TatB